MLLALYFVLLALLTIATRKRSQNVRIGLRLGYNLMFIAAARILTCVLSLETVSLSEILNITGKSLFMAVQNITFNGDIDWTGDMSIWFQAQVWFIVMIASVLTVQFVLLTFFSKIMRQLKMHINSLFYKTQYVFVGKEKDALTLIQDLCSKVHRPFIIYVSDEKLDDTSPLYHLCRVGNRKILKLLKKRIEYHIVILPDVQFKNMDLLYELNRNNDKAQNVHITVFLDNELIRFHDFYTDNVDAFLVSKEQLIVQRFLSDNPPVNILKQTHSFCEEQALPILKEPFELCVIGFGSIGQEFLLSTFENTAFIAGNDNKPFRALVIDKDISVIKEDFVTEVPYFEYKQQIEFVQTEIGTDEYYQAIRSRYAGLKQILIATGDTQINIRTTQKLCRYFDRIGEYHNRPQIVVILHESFEGAEYLLAKYPNVKTIDINEQIINFETLIDRIIDSGARASNEQYNKFNNSNICWNKLGTFTQNSNRAVIRDMYNKRVLFELCNTDMEQTLEFLAQYEHSRWNAFYYAHGWMTMPVSDLTEEERKTFRTKHPDEKRHICLVSWDELDALPQKTPGLLKYYDLENVKEALKRTTKLPLNISGEII